eukprot:850279-Pyramimonas_sp.AAC.1
MPRRCASRPRLGAARAQGGQLAVSPSVAGKLFVGSCDPIVYVGEDRAPETQRWLELVDPLPLGDPDTLVDLVDSTDWPAHRAQARRLAKGRR